MSINTLLWKESEPKKLPNAIRFVYIACAHIPEPLILGTRGKAKLSILPFFLLQICNRLQVVIYQYQVIPGLEATESILAV